MVSSVDAGDSMLQMDVDTVLVHAWAETALVCQSGNPITFSDNRNHKYIGLLSCICLFIIYYIHCNISDLGTLYQHNNMVKYKVAFSKKVYSEK